MKRKLGVALPDWYRWSDGRELSCDELKKFRQIRKRTKAKGESWHNWFLRVRGPIERYEAARAKIQVKRPGLLTRALAWVKGAQASTLLKLPR